MEILYKRATSVAQLTNFSFEFFNAIFTQTFPLLFLRHGAKKSKMTKNSNQGGPAKSAHSYVKAIVEIVGANRAVGLDC